jgi:hypothetical protein
VVPKDDAIKRPGGLFGQVVELLEMFGLYDTADDLVDTRSKMARDNVRIGRAVRHFGFTAVPWFMTLGYLGGIIALTFFRQRRDARKGLP